MARRSKDGSIIINVGTDAQKHLDRVAKRVKIANEKAARRAAKLAETKRRQALRLAGKRAAQMARVIQRQRDTAARRKAAREARKNWRPDPNRKKRSVHPKGAFATEKYNSYARRRERSKSLNAQTIDTSTCLVNSYAVKIANGKAISCTCADFTQLEGDRSWSGSNAGPFNPCKHMMAVEKGIIWTAIASTLYSGTPPTFCSTPALTNHPTISGKIYCNQKPITAVIDNLRTPAPGCAGKNHYKFLDSQGTELAFIGISSDGYTIEYKNL